MSGIFVCYRRVDSGSTAGRLYDSLRSEFGDNQVRRDLDSLEPGSRWDREIGEYVASCDALVVVVGLHWLDVTDPQGRPRVDDPNDQVVREISLALEHDRPIFPVLVDGAQMPPAERLPVGITALASRNALILSDHRWRVDVGRLVKQLREFVKVPRNTFAWVGGSVATVMATAAVLISVGGGSDAVAGYRKQVLATCEQVHDVLGEDHSGEVLTFNAQIPDPGAPVGFGDAFLVRKEPLLAVLRSRVDRSRQVLEHLGQRSVPRSLRTERQTAEAAWQAWLTGEEEQIQRLERDLRDLQPVTDVGEAVSLGGGGPDRGLAMNAAMTELAGERCRVVPTGRSGE